MVGRGASVLLRRSSAQEHCVDCRCSPGNQVPRETEEARERCGWGGRFGGNESSWIGDVRPRGRDGVMRTGIESNRCADHESNPQAALYHGRGVDASGMVWRSSRTVPCRAIKNAPNAGAAESPITMLTATANPADVTITARQ